MMYISILKTILTFLSDKKVTTKSKYDFLGDVYYEDSLFVLSLQKYHSLNAIHIHGEVFSKTFMITINDIDGKVFILQQGGDPRPYEKEYIESLIHNNETMSDVEFVLTYGRNPLSLNESLINILSIAYREGMFNV